MRHIRTAVEKTKEESLLGRFEELSKSVLKNNRLSTTDLPDYLGEPIKYDFAFYLLELSSAPRFQSSRWSKPIPIAAERQRQFPTNRRQYGNDQRTVLSLHNGVPYF